MEAKVFAGGHLLYNPQKDSYSRVPDSKFAVGIDSKNSASHVMGVNVAGKYFGTESDAKIIAGSINVHLPSGK